MLTIFLGLDLRREQEKGVKVIAWQWRLVNASTPTSGICGGAKGAHANGRHVPSNNGEHAAESILASNHVLELQR